MTDEPKTIQVIFVGRVETADKKIGMQLLPVDLFRGADSAKECIEVASTFEVKERDLPKVVGNVYQISGFIDEKSGSLNKIRGSLKFDPEGGLVRVPSDWQALWEARSEAAAVAARARKLEAQMAKDKSLPKVLRSIRDRYQSTDMIGRLALEVVVLKALRS